MYDSNGFCVVSHKRYKANEVLLHIPHLKDKRDIEWESLAELLARMEKIACLLCNMQIIVLYELFYYGCR
jgi:orotate phosphoribosyltransferase-like protein